MMNFFQLASDDASLIYLSKIFGSMGGLLPGSGSVTMFSTMFGTFNTIILAIGALVICYMTVVGVMATAHEGEFMGKKWNNIWIPIRTVLGISVLVPTASGYSAVQYVVMWIVIQGVAAADTVWSTTLAARSILNTPYGAVSLPAAGVQNSMNDLFKGLVCDATSRLTAANPSGLPTGGYYCNSNTCGTSPTLDPNASSMPLGPNGVCGSVNYCSMATACAPSQENSMKCLACQSQILALQSVIPTLSSIAEQFANIDYKYRDFIANSYNQPDNSNWQPVYDYCEAQNPPIPKSACCKASPTATMQTCQGNTTFPPDDGSIGVPYQSPSDLAVQNIYWPHALSSSLSVTGSSEDFMQTITDQYMADLTAGYTKYIQIAGQTGSAFGNATISIFGVVMPAGVAFQQADSWGWAYGGVFYYMIATEGGGPSGLTDAVPSLSIDLSAAQANLGNYRTNISAVDALLAAASNAANNAAGTGTTPQGTSVSFNFTSGVPAPMKLILTPVQDAFNGIAKVLSQVLTATGGPLTGLAILGQVLTITGTALYAIVFIGLAALGGVSLVDVYVLGNGFDDPIYGFVMLMTIIFTPMIYLMCGWMIAFGAICAVYIPLIPYMVFTFGVIGWMIAVIEAMVAAPLVALGILSPSGQHELMGKSEPAIMMMLNIFLRPSLMLFGLIAAMLLAVVVVELIFQSFFVVILFVSGGLGLANPIVLIAFISVLIALITSALNKCFTMIHLIPSQVMQWISGHHVPGGHDDSASMLGEAKGGVQKAGAVKAEGAGQKGSELNAALRKRGANTKARNNPTMKGDSDKE